MISFCAGSVVVVDVDVTKNCTNWLVGGEVLCYVLSGRFKTDLLVHILI